MPLQFSQQPCCRVRCPHCIGFKPRHSTTYSAEGSGCHSTTKENSAEQSVSESILGAGQTRLRSSAGSSSASNQIKFKAISDKKFGSTETCSDNGSRVCSSSSSSSSSASAPLSASVRGPTAGKSFCCNFS